MKIRHRFLRCVPIGVVVAVILTILALPSSAVDIYNGNFFDAPVANILVHDTETVTPVDGVPHLYKISTEITSDSGTAYFPIEIYFDYPWFTASTLTLEFSFICSNSSAVRSAYFYVGGKSYTCARAVNNGVVTCTANISGVLFDEHPCIGFTFKTFDAPVELYLQLLSCTVESAATASTYVPSTVFQPSQGNVVNSGPSFTILSSDTLIVEDYPGQQIRTPYTSSYSYGIQAPASAAQMQYIVLTGEFIVSVQSGLQQYFSGIIEAPGELCYLVVIDDKGLPVQTHTYSFVSDCTSTELVTDYVVTSYKIEGREYMVTGGIETNTDVNNSENYGMIQQTVDGNYYYYYYSTSDYELTEHDQYYYSTENWTVDQYGSILARSTSSFAFPVDGTSQVYRIQVGFLLPCASDPEEVTLLHNFQCSTEISTSLVSLDAQYLAGIFGDETDRVISAIREFFPDVTAINDVMSDIQTSMSEINRIEQDALGSMNSLQGDYDAYRSKIDSFITSDGNAFQKGFAVISTMLSVFADAYSAGNMLWVFGRIAFFGVAAYIVSRGRMPGGSSKKEE